MKNKGVIISLVILAGIIVMLIVTIMLNNMSGLKTTTNTETVVTLVNTVSPTTEEFIIDETEPIIVTAPDYSIEHYTYNDNMNVDIEYPVIYGMENELYQNNINQKIAINATSILLLDEDKNNIDTLTVTCSVENYDEKEMIIVYKGEMLLKNAKQDTPKRTAPSKKSNSGSTNSSTKKQNIAADPNYDNYGSYIPQNNSNNTNNSVNYDNYSNAVSMSPSSSLPADQVVAPSTNNYEQYAPISNNTNNSQQYPGANAPISGFASTKPTSKKVYYTSYINLEDCTDICLTDFANVNELVEYVKSNNLQFETENASKSTEIKNYLNKLSKSNLTNLLQTADYQNEPLKSFPKSFSYKKDGYIYFSLPVTHDLGDYVVAKYELSEK